MEKKIHALRAEKRIYLFFSIISLFSTALSFTWLINDISKVNGLSTRELQILFLGLSKFISTFFFLVSVFIFIVSTLFLTVARVRVEQEEESEK